MQHAVAVYVLQSPERHQRPAFDVSLLEDERLVLDDRFEVGVEEFQHEVYVLLDGKDVEKLPVRRRYLSGSQATRATH